MCSASFSAISSVVVSSMKVRLSHIIVRRNGTTMSTTWSFAWKRLRSLWTIAHLRNKILFTLGLLIYRVLAHILVPLTHQEQVNLVNLFGSNKSQNLGQLLGLLDVFSGGSLQTFSIGALGLAPYITATIVMQLLQPIIPALHDLSTQGEAGRLRFSQMTRMITIPLAFLQALGQSAIFVRAGVLDATSFNLFGPNWLATLSILLSLTAGTMILVWIGELITEHGIGNGISLIIFAGIVSRLPQLIQQGFLASTSNGGNGSGIVSIAVFLLIGLLTILGIVSHLSGTATCARAASNKARRRTWHARRFLANQLYTYASE